MRFGTFTLAAIVSAVLMLGVGYMVPESRRIAPNPPAPAEVRIKRTLAEPSALKAQDLPLRDVAGRLSRRHQIPIALDYDALRAEKLTGREPINLDVSGVSLRSLLNLVLRQVHLSYAVRDNAIVITTVEALEIDGTEFEGRIYPLPLSLSSQFAGEDALADLIRYTIAPHCWAEVGGPGEISVIPSALVVIQTPDIYEEIRYLLSQLECWQESPNPASPIYLSSWDREETILIEKLKQTVDVEFHETSLEDVCRHLSNEYDIPIVIDRRDLADLGLTVDAPITVDLRSVPLETALRKTFGSLDLGYWLLDGDVLEIIQQTSHGHELFTRAYPVGDLIGPHGRGAGHGLIEALTNVVDPVNWDYLGGPWSIGLLDGQHLLVTAERLIHVEVELLLGELRDVFHPVAPFADGLGYLETTRKIETSLRQPVTLQFENTALDDVAEWVGDTYGIEARLDPPMSPERADLPITCEIEGRSLEEALRDVLRPANRDVVVRDGVLWFAAAWERAERPIRRFYEVHQLVDPDFGFLDRRALIELIRDAAGPWDFGNHAGGWCNVAIYDGILIASETRDTQKAIGEVWSYLTANSQVLKREIEASDLSREETQELLLQRIQANVSLPAAPGDAEPDASALDLEMGLGGPP